MELRPHPKDCCNPIASLLGVIFHVLLHIKCLLFENCGDQLKRSLDETSFVNRHINLIVHVLKVEKKSAFFSFVY